MADFHNLQVKNISKETANAVSVLLDIPQHLNEIFTYKSGAYVTLQAHINGEKVRRAYSICSAPNEGKLKIAIKKVENGTFSVFAVDTLKTGDFLEVSTPEGRFLLDPKNNQNYLAFAAGSGITPILAMVKEVLSTTNSTFTLIYGNKSVADTMFYDELTLLAAKNPQFNLEFVYSRERNENAQNGRIDNALTNYFIKNKYKDLRFDTAYICGPEQMITAVSDALKASNFEEDNILFELFSVSVDEEATQQITEGKTMVQVLLDDEEFEFEMDQKDSLLAASLRNQIDAPYSCQGGVCSSCLAKVTEGKAVMVKNSILTDAEVSAGFVLTCQAHPTTSTIRIDFDDV